MCSPSDVTCCVTTNNVQSSTLGVEYVVEARSIQPMQFTSRILLRRLCQVRVLLEARKSEYVYIEADRQLQSHMR